jgi:hypothetical protein
MVFSARIEAKRPKNKKYKAENISAGGRGYFCLCHLFVIEI